MSDSERQGILLTNLGTPASPEAADVRRFLGEFLWDKHVLDMNPVARFLLLHGIILRTRPKKSAHAYREIWTEQGSPLLLHSLALLKALRAAMPTETIALGMRYGSPSIGGALRELHDQGCTHVLVCALYPQYATSTSYSTQEKVKAEIAAQKLPLSPRFLPAFYAHPAFIAAQHTIAKRAFERFVPDHVLMSFHGLPERHLLRGEHAGHCLVTTDCCAQITANNAHCYRAQCFATARALASSLDLEGRYTLSFQSRLGRTKWIGPYSNEVIVQLAQQGVKQLAVLCPAFVTDCLETLEEIALRAQESFIAAGGERLLLVPSLNADPAWVEALQTIIHDH